MTIEQLQRYKVKVIDAWRESRADYGIAQAVRDGFYLQTGEDASEYTPKENMKCFDNGKMQRKEKSKLPLNREKR